MYVLGRIERAAAIAAAAFLVQFGVGDPTRAQQLHKGVTGPQCAAMGGRITTWTNTAGSSPSVGECYVPASGASGKAAPPPSGNAGTTAGAVGGMLDLLSTLNTPQDAQPSLPSEAEEPPAAPRPSDVDAYETGRGVYDLAARQSRNRNYCRSAENFLLAARHFARAGDKTAAEKAMFQAGLVQADCKDQNERAVKAAAPKQAQRSGSCVTYFQNMRKLFRDNAAVCLKETRLLQSLVDMVGQSASGDPSFTRTSAPELFAILDPSDPGWTLSATRASPKCGVPLRVDAQNDAFSECARVYLCGAAAASCGLRRARETNSSDCIPISRTCLTQHPVPQLGNESGQIRNSWEPQISVTPSGPRAPANRSTITGPSSTGSNAGPPGTTTTAR
jgi:hypothetical protein